MTTGGVLSMLIAALVNVAELPALSVTVTDCVMPMPSFAKARGLDSLVDATPEVSSLVVKGMLTSEPFQPPAFGAGAVAPKVSAGGVASRLSVTLLELVPPFEVAVHVSVIPAATI